jgi:hypothetical protein
LFTKNEGDATMNILFAAVVGIAFIVFIAGVGQ